MSSKKKITTDIYFYGEHVSLLYSSKNQTTQYVAAIVRLEELVEKEKQIEKQKEIFKLNLKLQQLRKVNQIY